MAFIGTISRALLDRATAYYVNGQPITVLDAAGQTVIGAAPPSAPSIIGTIADRTYEVGSGPYTINLAEKISGADSYVVTPANANLSLSGNTLTITPTATLNQTTISIIGRNGGGDSTPLTFALTVNAVAPTVTTPLPDRNLAFGAANVSIALDDFFAGVASYAVSPAANGATISGRNLVLSAAQVRSLDITVTGTNSTGQAVSDTFLFAVAQTTQAPSVQTPPSITGSTTVGSILTRTAGAATGIPSPTRATVWLRNDEVIPGQTGNTLDTSGFAADDVITTRDDWTNSQGTASGTSAPWTLTVQPAITATIDLQPAGQQSSITFNVAIDGSPTIAQGSTSITATRVGTTNQWRFIASIEGPISFAATKAGYTAFSDATRTVAPAPSALVERNYELMIEGADPGSEPVEIIEPQEYAGVYDISDATYTNGMRVLVPAVIARTGDIITATRNPLFSWFEEVEPVQFGWAYYRGTTTLNAALIAGTEGAASYTENPALDGGKNVYRRDWIENAEGFEVGVFSNGIAVAALLKTTDTFTTAATSPISIDAHSGNNDANNRVYNTYGTADIARVNHNDFLYGSGYGFVSTSEAVGTNYKVEANARTTLNSATSNPARGLRLAVGVKSGTEGFQLSYDDVNSLLRVLKGGATVVKSYALTIGYMTTWKPALTVHEHDDGSGNPTATLRVYVNDIEIPELSVTDPDLRGGKPGFRVEAGTGNHHFFYDLTVEQLA